MTHFKMDQIKVEQFAILEDKLPQDEIDFSAELMHGASKEDKVIAKAPDNTAADIKRAFFLFLLM